MSGNLKAEIVLEWADGEYLFALKGKEIEELESLCGKVGIAAISQRVHRGEWFFADIYHIIRLGLIGGGMGAVEAKRKTDMYCGQQRLAVPLANGPNNPVHVATAVMGAVFFGLEDLQPGEAEAGENPAKDKTSEVTAPVS